MPKYIAEALSESSRGALPGSADSIMLCCCAGTKAQPATPQANMNSAPVTSVRADSGSSAMSTVKITRQPNSTGRPPNRSTSTLPKDSPASAPAPCTVISGPTAPRPSAW
jgi:hypothetical protein